VRGADDCADSDLAVHRERENGRAALADGIDPGDGGGESFASGVLKAAQDFNFAGKWSAAGGNCSDGFDGKGIGKNEVTK